MGTINGEGTPPLYHFMGQLSPDHYVVYVQPGMMEKALEIFINFGWHELFWRRQSWDDYEVRFVGTNLGNYPRIQLTELKSVDSIATLPVVHLGFTVCLPNSPKWIVDLLRPWCQKQGIKFEAQDIGDKKWFICFPEIFGMKFELVPAVS